MIMFRNKRIALFDILCSKPITIYDHMLEPIDIV
jgi:hypothetical protein